MSFGPLEILALAAFLGLLTGFAGGMGGRKLAMRAVYRDFDALAADFAASSDRLKRVEGRSAQDKKRGGGDGIPGLTPEFLQLLASGAGPKRAQLVSQAPPVSSFPPHDPTATPCGCRECSETYEADLAAKKRMG